MRIVDVGSNKPAAMYSRSFAAETGPIKLPAALKYCDIFQWAKERNSNAGR
jgi:hypothetical protein